MLVGALHYSQFLTVDTGASSSCPSRIASLDHKILVHTINYGITLCRCDGKTYRDNTMKYNPVVVTSFSKFCKIFASLQLTDRDQFYPKERKKLRRLLEGHGPSITPAEHHPNLFLVRLNPWWVIERRRVLNSSGT